MPVTSRSFRDVVQSLLSPPDEIMLELGASGELVVARLRVLLGALLLLLPLAHALAGGSLREVLIGLVAAMLINVFALAWLQLARRPRRYDWLPFATAAFDVTATTAVLVVLALEQLPAALNSTIAWSGYVLAIMLTVLRTDGRTTLFAGALAISQYALLVAFAFALAFSPEQLISSEHGSVSLGSQIMRLVLLTMVTGITTTQVYRLQRLVELSGTDGLTRLPNRSWLLHRIPRLIETSRHDGSSLTLALIDIDSFKRVNDEAGHRAGDRALRHVVATLKDLMEPGEWLVRLGGQEFVLVLHQPVGSAWERVDAIRRQVAARPFDTDHGQDCIVLTISAGLASFPHDGNDVSRLLHRADRRLQTAKRDGRNRVVARDE